MISSGLISSSVKPQLTVDKVEKVQRKRVTCIIGHVLQLTYSAVFDIVIHEEKVNRCDGCAIHHPSQRQHSCLMMDRTKMPGCTTTTKAQSIRIMSTKRASVCSALGFKLSNSWEAYVIELLTFPWASIYLTSLEIERCGEDLNSPIM